MSNRKFITIKYKTSIKGMRPYTAKLKYNGKYYIEKETPNSQKTKALKLQLKNANRSFKKTVRQQAKKQIKILTNYL